MASLKIQRDVGPKNGYSNAMYGASTAPAYGRRGRRSEEILQLLRALAQREHNRRLRLGWRRVGGVSHSVSELKP